MKALLAVGIVAVIAMLGVVAYQINRTTWSPDDQKCADLFVSYAEKSDCINRLHTDEKQQASIDRLLNDAATH